jgi:transcriptional regulator with XRE-family HTH domain
MIKNERQYRITKASAEKFEQSLTSFDSEPASADVHPLLRKAERDALVSQLDELRNQLYDYESLKHGERPVVALNPLAELPRQLVRARIVAGLSQKDLAARLNMKEQQIQRYEANDYEGASLSRLQQVCDALNVNIQENVFMPTAGLAAKTLYKRMSEAGLDKEFVTSRLVPPGIAAKARSNPEIYEDHLVFHAVTAASQVYGWTPTALLGSEGLAFDAKAVAGSARFKLRANTDEKKLTAYTVYAYYLAELVLRATDHLPVKPLPTDAKDVQAAILGAYGRIDFRSTLAYVWDQGVPVLPLNDPGAFFGAFWRVNGRNVIVLKQRTNFPARWLDDLLHEFRHAGEEPAEPSRTVLEAPETSEERCNSNEEIMATLFASDVVLDGRAEEIVKKCISATRRNGSGSGRLEHLKSVVPAVAEKERVPVDSLANYLAYRLSSQNENWWATAANLQRTGENPWEMARDALLTRVNFSRLTGVDRDLLTRALLSPEGNEP